MSEEPTNAAIEKAVDTIATQQSTDDVLQCRLDAVEVLQMTLEDVESHQSEDDVSTVLERVEMCCRFLESAPWSDKNGIIENIGLKLIEIHMSLSNGKRIGTDCIGTNDWGALGTVLASMNFLEIPEQPSAQLLKRDFSVLKLMVFDRIKKLLVCGPLDFSNRCTLQLLERIELCRRYLNDNDSDLKTLKLVTNDILCLSNLIDCYEVMEFWEAINFKKWNMKSVKKSSRGFGKTIKRRKVYSVAAIKEEKFLFEDHWRKVLANKSTDYRPPTMMKSYPDHPYLSYAKKNRSDLRRKNKVKSNANTISANSDVKEISSSCSSKTDSIGTHNENVTARANAEIVAAAAVPDNIRKSPCHVLPKSVQSACKVNLNEVVTETTKACTSSVDEAGLQSSWTKQKCTIPTFSELNAPPGNLGPSEETTKISPVETIRKEKSSTIKKVVSVIQSERRLFSNKIKEQNKDGDLNLGATKSPMYIRVGVPQDLKTHLHLSIERFISTRFDKKHCKSSDHFLRTVSNFREFCFQLTGDFLGSLRKHVSNSILDIVAVYDPGKEGLINRLMIYMALRIKAFHKAVEQLEKCCNLSSNKKSKALEMTTFSVKDVFKKLAVVCCTDKLVVPT